MWAQWPTRASAISKPAGPTDRSYVLLEDTSTLRADVPAMVARMRKAEDKLATMRRQVMLEKLASVVD